MNVTPTHPADLRDARCMISGVSLLGAECGTLILSEDAPEVWQPLSLPLFGRYLGRGTLDDINEGPGAELLVQELERHRRMGQLIIDEVALGLEQPPLDHIGALFELLALAHIHAPGAVRLAGRRLSYCLFSSHVAASLMEGEPGSFPVETPLEQLPPIVFGRSEVIAPVYGRLAQFPIKLRCRFGLSLAGLCCLKEELARRHISFHPPGELPPFSDLSREGWLAQALDAAEQDELLLAALGDYVSDLNDTSPED